ncbi:hypothetical protein LZP73_09080 [Shewanella sp. AS16]|uniref:hypothetical protein n=1 Tax=Shewanella sp. AS16 TaxID=2907625 RepID=UPI001F2190A2|nr:hypothetical protein [Shewanella sp. AS16]MCE9686364.1 hypothetical protein [Shewanella sp. AS16]
MKGLLLSAMLLFSNVTLPAFAADVGISISIGQPGFYGQIEIGDFPQPEVIYGQPILIEPLVISRPVIYLRVPLYHARDWRRYCHYYRACGERVMFVRDSWYTHTFVPYYRQHRQEYENRRHHDRGDKHYYRDYRDRQDDDHSYRDRGDGNSQGHKQKYRDDKGNRGKGHGDQGKGKGKDRGHEGKH